MTELATSGELYALGCALVWAVAVILFRKSGDHVPPVVLNLFKNTVGLTLVAATMLVLGVAWAPAERGLADWLVLMASGALGIALSDTLFFAALNKLGAGRMAIMGCAYSPLVILCAFVYLGEPVGPMLLLATFLVGGGIFVGTWHRRRAATREAPPADLAAGIGLAFAATLGMAVGIVIAKPVLEVADPWWSTEVRLLGAMPILMLQGMQRRYRGAVVRCFSPGPHWKFVVPAAALGTYVALVLWILGFKYADAGPASVLNQTSTLAVLVLATIFLKEPLTGRRVLAVALGIAGAVLAVL